MTATTHTKNLVLNFVFRGTGTAPSAWYVGLLTDGAEVSGVGYVRQAVTFLAPIAGVVRNSADISFGAGDADWGTISGYGVYDASTAGNLLAEGSAALLTPDGTNALIIAAGEIEISLE